MKLKAEWSVLEDHNEKRSTSLIGKIVYVHCNKPMDNLSYALSTAHLIGWDCTKDKEDVGYFTFIALADGMTTHKTLAELIDTLNGGPYVPIPSSVLQAIMLEKQPLK